MKRGFQDFLLLYYENNCFVHPAMSASVRSGSGIGSQVQSVSGGVGVGAMCRTLSLRLQKVFMEPAVCTGTLGHYHAGT